jgi:RIO kinase 2
MSTKAIAGVFRTLETPDLRVLTGIELALGSHAYPPIEDIRKYANLPLDEVRFRLNLLQKKGLLRRVSPDMIGYEGYSLNYSGYDCLALNALVKAGAVDALGNPLGIGKESDVYEGLRGKRRVTLKFHRIGRISFRQTRRTRGFVASRSHTSWIYQSRLAAEREFQTLKLVHRHRVSVPLPIAHNRHVVVMGLIQGLELNDVGTIDAPEIVLNNILLNIRKAYVRAKIVHGDLSEFNVMVRKNGKVLIIDWPQSIRANHPNATDILRRDVEHVLKFFKRKFKTEYPIEQTLAYVMGQLQQPQAAA